MYATIKQMQKQGDSKEVIDMIMKSRKEFKDQFPERFNDIKYQPLSQDDDELIDSFIYEDDEFLESAGISLNKDVFTTIDHKVVESNQRAENLQKYVERGYAFEVIN